MYDTIVVELRLQSKLILHLLGKVPLTDKELDELTNTLRAVHEPLGVTDKEVDAGNAVMTTLCNEINVIRQGIQLLDESEPPQEN